jgi:hypothetical protein
MTLEQIKNLIIGVLRGWFLNKQVLDKFSVNEQGTLLFDNAPVSASGASDITQEQLSAAIAATIAELNGQQQESQQEEPQGDPALNVNVQLAPSPTEAEGIANNNAVRSITFASNIATVTVDLNDLQSFASSNSSQGTHKWIALEVNTGISPITNVKYNGYNLEQQDISDALATGCSDKSFVLYIKAEEVASAPKTFTLSADNYSDTGVTIMVVEP